VALHDRHNVEGEIRLFDDAVSRPGSGLVNVLVADMDMGILTESAIGPRR
jgi:hypothetical protein